MELLTLTDHFRYFLTIRPAIVPDKLAKELGIHRANLNKIVKGQRKVRQPKRGEFSRAMIKYGYQDHLSLWG